MSISLNQIAYNIRNKIEGGRAHHNTYITTDQIKFNVETYRALFLRREIERNNEQKEFEQSLTLEVSRVTMGESSGMGLPDHVLRSERIPVAVRLRNRDGITYVATTDRKTTIPVVDYHTVLMTAYNKYTAKQPRAFVMDSRVWVYGDPVSLFIDRYSPEDGEDENGLKGDISKIFIRGIFENPAEAMMVQNPELDATNVDDEPYPLSADMVQRITEGLITGQLPMLLNEEDEEAAQQAQQQQR